jgi:PST family polysaccharide transporter
MNEKMTSEKKCSEYFDTESLHYDLKKKAIQGGGSMLISRTTNFAIQFVSTVILARLLTPEDFGLVTMVTAFSLLFFNVGLNGFSEAIIQKERVTRPQVSTLFWIGLAISTGLAILFSVCSPLLARFYKEPRLIPIAMTLSIGFIFSALATEHIALIMRNMQFYKLMVNEVAAGILGTGIAIWMALNDFGYWAIVARQLSIPIFSAIFAWLQCPWRPGLPAKDPEIRPMIRFAVKTFGNFFVRYIERNSDKILLGRRWGGQEVGNYDRAYYLFVLPANQLVVPLSGVALATLSRLHKEPERYKLYYLKALSLLTLIGMLVSVVMTINGRDIVLFVLGPQWQKTGAIFSALGPAIGMTVISATIGWLHLSQGNPGRWLRWGIFSAVFTVLSLFVGLPFGALGVAIAYSLSFYVLTWPGIWYAAKPMGIRISELWKTVWIFLAAAILSGLTTSWAVNNVLFIMRLLEHGHVLVRIGFATVLCTLLYFVAVIILYGGIRPILEMGILFKMVMPRARDENGLKNKSE